MDYTIDENIPGWGCKEYLIMYASYAAKVPAGGCIVEIGSFLGKSAYAFGMNKRDDVKLYCVDGWFDTAKRPASTFGTTSPPYGNTDQIYSLDNCLENLSDVPNLHTIKTTLPYDENAIQFNEKIDLLFIDANHTYVGTKENIRQWFNKMREGGIMLFDDFSVVDSPGVVQAVNEFVSDNNLRIRIAHNRIAIVEL